MALVAPKKNDASLIPKRLLTDNFCIANYHICVSFCIFGGGIKSLYIFIEMIQAKPKTD